MNVQFCSLFPGDFPRGLNSFMLGVKTPRYAVGTGLSYSPFPVSGNDMLTSSGHVSSSSHNRNPTFKGYYSRGAESTKRSVTIHVNSVTQNTGESIGVLGTHSWARWSGGAARVDRVGLVAYERLTRRAPGAGARGSLSPSVDRSQVAVVLRLGESTPCANGGELRSPPWGRDAAAGRLKRLMSRESGTGAGRHSRRPARSA